MLFQCHTEATYGTVPPFSIYLNTTGYWEIAKRTGAAYSSRVVLRREDYLADRWQWFVMKGFFSDDPARNPYIKIWRAAGDGPLELIVDDTGVNFYPNQPQCYWKTGYYKYTATWLGATSPSDPISFDPQYPTRVLYKKGVIGISGGIHGSPELTPEIFLQNLKAF